MTISIIMRFTFEGVHSWPEAPDRSPESHLRNPHRHLFHVEATKHVTHTERDIEFIGLSRSMRTYCEQNFAGPHPLSCESIAKRLLHMFLLQSCRVLEDGENGAEVSV